MLLIVDYGLGNLGSVKNMLRVVGADATISDKPADVDKATALILVGVGHFDSGMKNLHGGGFVEPLNRRVLERKVPVLGICLGMQLLSRDSEEGQEKGLGWLPASTKRLQPGDPSLAIPHMGWNETASGDGVLLKGLEAARFYFVHSYHVVCDEPGDVAATCTYGKPFTAAVRRGNIFGTQFHPEKSHRFGKRLLQNFVDAIRHA
jgi:glutamine amidotransferase